MSFETPQWVQYGTAAGDAREPWGGKNKTEGRLNMNRKLVCSNVTDSILAVGNNEGVIRILSTDTGNLLTQVEFDPDNTMMFPHEQKGGVRTFLRQNTLIAMDSTVRAFALRQWSVVGQDTLKEGRSITWKDLCERMVDDREEDRKDFKEGRGYKHFNGDVSVDGRYAVMSFTGHLLVLDLRNPELLLQNIRTTGGSLTTTNGKPVAFCPRTDVWEFCVLDSEGLNIWRQDEKTNKWEKKQTIIKGTHMLRGKMGPQYFAYSPDGSSIVYLANQSITVYHLGDLHTYKSATSIPAPIENVLSMAVRPVLNFSAVARPLAGHVAHVVGGDVAPGVLHFLGPLGIEDWETRNLVREDRLREPGSPARKRCRKCERFRKFLTGRASRRRARKREIPIYL